MKDAPPLRRLLSLTARSAIAHRGGAALRPENTWIAFEHAHALGVDALECDVHLSRDGEVVVIHDATLDRTTDATGLVEALTAHELEQIDAGYRFGAAAGFPFRGTGAGVPRLATVLDRIRDRPWIIEIKGERAESAERVLDVVSQLGAEARVVIGGFSQAVLGAVRQRQPGLVTGASSAEVQSMLRRTWICLAPRAPAFEVLQVPVRLRGRRVLTRRFVAAARRVGIPVQAWIVDAPEQMRELLAWGVTGLISDRPDLAIEEVRRHVAAPL